MYMTPPYINNNQGSSYLNRLGLGNVYKGDIYSRATQSPAYKNAVNKNSNIDFLNTSKKSQYNLTPAITGKDKSGSSLGDFWKDAKEYTMGTSIPTMSKNVGGKFDRSFWTDAEWKQFEDMGGYFNDKGQLFSKEGNAFDVTKISGDKELEALGKSTEGGLFSGEGFDRVGKAAENAGRIFSAYQAADNIFGRGAKSRREAERQMKKDFEQRYAMNQMTMDKFREDNEHFKQQRAAITAAY